MKDGYDILSSCDLTPSQDIDPAKELFTWILKKSSVTNMSSAPCDSATIVVSKGKIHVGGDGDGVVAVRNTVKNVIEAHEDQSKVNESGYTSEEDKKDSEEDVKKESVEPIVDIGISVGSSSAEESDELIESNLVQNIDSSFTR